MGKRIAEIFEYLLKDRSYLDLWSIAHFVFGILIGLILNNIKLPLITSIFAALSVLTFWEIIEPEIFSHILNKEFRENPLNQISDIIYGFIGFLAYWWVF